MKPKFLCLLFAWVSACALFGQTAFPVIAPESAAWQVTLNPAFGTSRSVAVTGQPFTEAMQLTVTKLPGKFWDVQYKALNAVPVTVDSSLTLSFYARSAEPKGRLAVKVEKVGAATFFANETYELTPEWKKFELSGPTKADVFPGQLRVIFMAGQQLQTVEIGGVSLQATPSVLSAEATAPLVVPAGMDAYNTWLVKDLKDRLGVTAAPLFAPTEEAMNKQVWTGGPSFPGGATKSIIEVTGQPFTQAIAFDITKPKGENWHIGAGIWNPVPLVKGRTYMLTFYARGRVPGIGGMNAVADFNVRNRKDQKFWVQLGVSVGDSWQRFYMPFVAQDNIEKAQLLQSPIISLGMQVQQFEVGGLAMLDCGPTPLAKLPGLKAPTMDYAERVPDAPWRKEAEARIEKIRKGDLAIQVVDAAGRPVPNAEVKVAMKRHAFSWGTALGVSYTMLNDKPLPTLERENFPKYFNHIALENDLKQYNWLKKTPEKKAEVIRLIKGLKEQGYTLNNGVIIWPGFRTNQSWLPLQDKPAELKVAVDDFITEIATVTAPYVDEVVVVNEPYSDREIARIFGEEEAFTHWYSLVRKLQPNARLMLNEAGLTSNNDGQDVPRQEFIYNLSKMLIGKGLLDIIGDQAHYNTPVALANVSAVWDRLASLGKPLQVTEYDVSFGDDEQLEADYTRDLTTLAFAHPAIEAFTMWGFIDELHWKKNAPLFSAKDGKTLTLKPSGKAWIDLVFGKWWTKVDGETDGSGQFATRGFLGDYEVTVTANGQTQSVPAKLVKTGTVLTVKLK